MLKFSYHDVSIYGIGEEDIRSIRNIIEKISDKTNIYIFCEVTQKKDIMFIIEKISDEIKINKFCEPSEKKHITFMVNNDIRYKLKFITKQIVNTYYPNHLYSSEYIKKVSLLLDLIICYKGLNNTFDENRICNSVVKHYNNSVFLDENDYNAILFARCSYDDSPVTRKLYKLYYPSIPDDELLFGNNWHNFNEKVIIYLIKNRYIFENNFFSFSIKYKEHRRLKYFYLSQLKS